MSEDKPVRPWDMFNKNIHVFVLSNQEDKVGSEIYSCLGTNKLLLYKPNKLKMMQKKFYKYYVKPILNKSNDSIMSFDTYYNAINNEHLDVKYIILKDNDLRYN